REGYEVLEVVTDPGQSGASLERPGMDHVRDLVASKAGGVSVVLAQDRDRIAREPAYHYFLRREFEEHGTKLRALNDTGDDSPEGELTDGILDQLAKFQRAQIARNSRRGKLQKAREGKVVAGHTANYGFRFNAARDGYEVDEEKMQVMQRIFHMVGVEGVSLGGVRRNLRLTGVKSPAGGEYWSKRIIKRFILDDVYKPHAFEEVKGLVSPEVASKLDPEKRYGVWWFNRRRTTTKQVSEPSPSGRVYRKHSRVTFKDKTEWIAVPIAESGIPREWVDAARAIVAEYRSPSKLAGRFWELSGALMRCGNCGRAMEALDRYYRTKSGEKGVICYYRCREGNRRNDTCQNRKSIRSDWAHSVVWELVSGLLKNPQRLRTGLEAIIEEERKGLHGNPERAKKTWLEKLAEVDRKRSRFQDMAAEGYITFDELGIKLSELDETRATALRELGALDHHRERVAELEAERDTLLESYADVTPGAIDAATPEDRHRVYRLLNLRVVANTDGTLEVSGALINGQKLGDLVLTSML
ncbi:MAG: site-specific recombinase, partial [Rubrobacteraceae bacterium]|nr:site-specific recombinase [Rubrobacteraceae bacterium]